MGLRRAPGGASNTESERRYRNCHARGSGSFKARRMDLTIPENARDAFREQREDARMPSVVLRRLEAFGGASAGPQGRADSLSGMAIRHRSWYRVETAAHTPVTERLQRCDRARSGYQRALPSLGWKQVHQLTILTGRQRAGADCTLVALKHRPEERAPAEGSERCFGARDYKRRLRCSSHARTWEHGSKQCCQQHGQ